LIAIVDYDIGNLGAVANMLNRMGGVCRITANPDHIAQADRLILPGNGAFDACMRNLQASGLVPLLEEKIFVDKVPLLGICVGAQMLGHGSDEGTMPGLGWLDMRVRRFPELPGLRIPHMGWSQVISATPHSITLGLDAEPRFYFVHSYYMDPAHSDAVILRANYGIDFAAAIAHENMTGVQFHPEKSHRYGKQLLANFMRGD
jgi:imidazole glycerol-phosphate synthase subunit HisH